jgi:hypothetical protein
MVSRRRRSTNSASNSLTEKQHQQILDLYQETPRGAQWIARKLDVPVAAVRRVIKLFPSRAPYPAQLVENVISSSRKGFSIKQMAYQFGVSADKIKRIRASELTLRERRIPGRPGSPLTPEDDVRLRRKLRQILSALSREEKIGYQTVRRRFKKIL